MNASSSVAAPRASISPAGVSVASTRPESISEIRSQRSASFMKWVETKIVTPWLRDRSISSSQNAVARQRIDAGGRLVEDQHLRLVDDRDRKRKPLANAERQIRGALVEIIREAEPFDQLGDARLRLPRRQVEQPRVQRRGSAGP